MFLKWSQSLKGIIEGSISEKYFNHLKYYSPLSQDNNEILEAVFSAEHLSNYQDLLLKMQLLKTCHTESITFLRPPDILGTVSSINLQSFGGIG